MKLYALYKAFPCDEKGIKTKVQGRVEVDTRPLINTRQILTREELYEAAQAKLYQTVPSLRGTPIIFYECGVIEEVNHV